MKTEMKTVYLQVCQYNGTFSSSTSLELNFEENETNDTFAYKTIQSMEIALPVITDYDMAKMMAGVELEQLIKQKEKINAETFRKLAQIDERIAQLQALEDKSC